MAHPRRQEAHDIATDVVKRLHGAGIDVVMQPDEAATLGLTDHPGVLLATAQNPAEGCELICVLGGDGTILRGAEMSRGTGAPLLGVNLGHVGFLAEGEREDISSTVEHIVARTYTVEERMTLEVTAHVEAPRSTPAGRSTRSPSRRPTASACSRWSPRSTVGR